VPELDGVRGLAVLLVLGFHFIGLATIAGRESWLWPLKRALSLAWSGVDLFFVLSGFLIGGILIEHRESPSYFRTFYIRRTCRILPLYVLLVAVAFLWKAGVDANTIAGNAFLGDTFHPLWSYATFTQNFVMAEANGYGTNWLAATWSLAVEEQFYLVLPLLIWLTPARKLPWMLAGCIVAAPVIRLAFLEFHTHQGYPAHVLMPGRADALMLGVLAAWALRHAPVRRVLSEGRGGLYAVFALLLAGLGLLTLRGAGVGGFRMGFLGGTWLALLYLVFILIAVTEARGPVSALTRLTPLRGLGQISYGVYLLHQPIAGLVYGRASGGAPRLTTTSDAALMLLTVVLTLVLAWLSWRLLERPLQAWGHSFRYEAPAAAAVEAARPRPSPEPFGPVPRPLRASR
jgi:peptidoglycan/LPS O-acetylase OafA/YrhL